MIGKLLRKLPDIKGKRRIVRLLLKSKINSLEDIIIKVKYSCKFKIPNIKEEIGFELFINGVYEKKCIDFIVNKIDKNKILLDIGANIGAIAIPIGKQRPDLKIVCIEAAAWLFDYLKFNFQLNNIQNFQLMNFAIAEKEGKEVAFYSPHDAFGKGSMAAVFTSESETVKTKTIDVIINEQLEVGKVGMIKIDIEGFEYYAFLGGQNYLKKDDAPDILFEFVDWAENSSPGITAGAAQELLLSYGYHIYIFENGLAANRITEPILNGAYMFFATKKDGLIDKN